MIRIRDLSMMPGSSKQDLRQKALKLLKIREEQIESLSIFRKSIDARKKPAVKIIYTIDVSIKGNEEAILKRSGCKFASIVHDQLYAPPKYSGTTTERPIIVGFGPAGMFAALILAKAGLKPIVLERGEDADTRHKKIETFFSTGKLDSASNVQFGEGGAGTFSDGKLNTGVNNPRIAWILREFVRFGARENIVYDAKPHVGTDILLTVVQNLRREVISLGGEVHFNAQVERLEFSGNSITGVKLKSGKTISGNRVILAIGHSARDTFATLLNQGVPMEPKPFSMGVRIEHPQSLVNQSQFGQLSPLLPAADYKLVSHLNDRTVYTFCMCPGGYVVAAASEENSVVTNGMSYADRAGENANSALLVTINPVDFPYEGVLGGVKWQQEIEKHAFEIGGGNYYAPAQTVGDFLNGTSGTPSGTVTPTYRPGVTWCDLHSVLPKVFTDAIEEALPKLNRNLVGFSDPDAVMTAPETRSSSPVRIIRDDHRMSAIRGLYPCGEGAGYAGGIMSAAIDGIMTAEEIIRDLSENCEYNT